MNKLTIFSDTHFILATGQNLLSRERLTIIETEIKEWIKNGGLLCLPFDCEIEDLRTITPQETVAYVDAEIAHGMEQIGQSLVAAIQNASR